MYEFAEEAGSMERSRYFGFSKGAAAQAAAVLLCIACRAVIFFKAFLEQM
jgi:hypothetical protein